MSDDTASETSNAEDNERVSNSPASSNSDSELDTDDEFFIRRRRDYKTIFVYDIDDITLLTEDQLIKTMGFQCRYDLSFLTRRWVNAMKCLTLVDVANERFNEINYANVVICEEEVDDAKKKLHFTGLYEEVPFSNIYSTATQSIEEVLDEIENRFECRIVVISSNEELIRIADNKLHFIFPVYDDENFENLYNSQLYEWMARKNVPTLAEMSRNEFIHRLDRVRSQIYEQLAQRKVQLLTNVFIDELELHADPEIMYQVLAEEIIRHIEVAPETEN